MTEIGLVWTLLLLAGTVALVAHNPGMEDLASSLAGRYVAMPTSALAVLDVDGPWADAGPETVTLRAAGRPPAT